MAFGYNPARRPAARRLTTSNPFASSWGGHGRPMQGFYRPSPVAPVTPTASIPPAAAQPQPQSQSQPQPPAASQSQGIGSPLDPIFEAGQAALARQRTATETGLAGEQTRTLSNYGYGAQVDPLTGAVSNLTFDPSNPFSQAALLRKNYAQQNLASETSLGSRGHAYGGAVQNAANYNTGNYLQGENSLKTALISALAGIAGRRGQAGTDYELGVAGLLPDKYARAAAADTGETGGTDVLPASVVPPPPSQNGGGQGFTPAQMASSWGRGGENSGGRGGSGFTPAQMAGSWGRGGGSSNSGLKQSIPNYRSPSGRVGTLHIYNDGRRVFVPK